MSLLRNLTAGDYTLLERVRQATANIARQVAQDMSSTSPDRGLLEGRIYSGRLMRGFRHRDEMVIGPVAQATAAVVARKT